MAKNPKMGRPVLNKHKVPTKQWDKWSNLAKQVFNKLMDATRPGQQWVFLHPAATPAPKEHWMTTRWNMAWTAANLVDGVSAPRIILDVVIPEERSRKASKKMTRQPPKPAPNLGLPKLK